MKKRVLAVFLAIFLMAGVLPGTARAADSTDVGDWLLSNVRYDKVEQYFVLTEDYTSWDTGSIWYNHPCYGNFTFEMDYYTGTTDRSLGGADGIAVAFYADHSYTMVAGEEMGFNGSKGYGIELDTYENYTKDDPNYNHIALIKESVGNHLAIERLPESEDEQWHHLKIIVEDKMCSAYVDDVQKLSHEVEQTGYGWIGITSATGTGENLHAVKNIMITDNSSQTIESYLNITLSNTLISESEKGQYKFRITADIKNSGSTTAENVVATLDLAKQLQITDSAPISHELGDINREESKQVSWTVCAEWPQTDITAIYGVTVNINNVADLRQEDSIYLKAKNEPDKIYFTLPDGVKFVPYSWGPENTNGTYTPVGPLPSGLDLNAKTGEISGIPMTDDTWEITIQQTVTENDQTVTNNLIYVITVQNNTDDNVPKPNDYEIIDPVGTEISENHFVLDSYRDETLVIDGPYQEFTRLLIDGKTLIRDKDYEAREGSTVITIFGQTFANQGTGTHTISAEFRNTQGTLKTVSQNYTVTLPTPTPPRPAVTAKPSTTTTKPADTTPEPAPEEPAEEEPAVPEGLPFGDVSPENWFYDDVVWAYEGEIMTGVTANSFAPQTSISQATIVTVLSRMANVDLEKFSGVTDPVIASGQWYTEAAIWAKQSGLLPDYNVFTGNETISRDQMAIMLSKYLQSMGKDTTIPAQPVMFADAGEMSADGNNAFQVLYEYNIFRGVGDGRMDPAGATTRAQFAALIHRVYALAAGKSAI